MMEIHSLLLLKFVAFLLLFLSVLNQLVSTSKDVDIEIISKPEKCDHIVGRSSFVTVHYTGTTSTGDKIESTHDRGVPIEFQAGLGMVFVGLDEGILGMCVGEKRRLAIPAEKMHLANGKAHPHAPAGVDAIYEVEVLSLAGATTMNTFHWLDVNKDDKLSKKEVRELIHMTLQSNAQFSHLKEDNVLDFYVTMHDTNKDSFVSREEFEDSFLTTQGEEGKLKDFVKHRTATKEEL